MTSGQFWMRWLVATLLFVLVLPAVAEAARFKVGDAVQFQDWRKRWLDGTVIETKRNNVMIEYTDTFGKLKRDVVTENVVRFACEQGAIAPMRQWVDATGTFKITAATLGIEGNSLKLRRADMSEIEVPIDKLGDADKRYIERLKRELGGFAVAIPEQAPVTTFDAGRIPPQMPVDTARIALDPDPLPPYLRLKQGGVGFPRFEEGGTKEEFGTVIPVGGPQSLVLVSAERHSRGWSQENGSESTRLLWISLAEQKIVKQQRLPPGEYVLDYHAPTHRLLTYNILSKEQTSHNNDSIALAIWEVLPTDDQAKAVVRWDVWQGKKPDSKPWGRLINGQIVLHRLRAQEYVGWHIDSQRMAYRLQQESFNRHPVVLSGGRKYAFLPEADKVRIFDPMTGSALTALPVPTGAKALALSDDCQKAAVLEGATLHVWDLTDAMAPVKQYYAFDISNKPFLQGMFWLGNDRIVVKTLNEMFLYSLPQQFITWSYQFEHNTSSMGDEHRPILHVVNNNLVYGATLRGRGAEGLAVGNVKLPGPQVDETASRLNRKDLEVAVEGQHVRLEVRCGDQISPAVYQALVKKIEDNGWILDQNQTDTILYADVRPGKTTSVTVNRGLSEDQASYTAQVHSMRIVKNQKVIWESQTGEDPPLFVSIPDHESAQQYFDRTQKPNLAFFERTNFPSSVINPTYARGFGTTRITTEGLVPGKLLPPPEIEKEERPPATSPTAR